MSQKRDRGQQSSSPTSTASDEFAPMAATYAPAQSVHGSVSQYPRDLPPGATEPSWGVQTFPSPRYVQSVAPSTLDPSYSLNSLPSGAGRPANPPRRPPGAAPLADILLQEPTAAVSSRIASRANPSQNSPTYSQPDLSPLRLHGEPPSPERSRQEYFDPARSALGLGQDVVTSPSRPLHGSLGQPGPSRNNQAFPLASDFTSSSRVPPTTTPLSHNDRARLRLRILQQPKAARACGLGERDRRVVDPPPILQLKILGYDPSSPHDREILRAPFNIVNCLLIAVPNRNAPLSIGQDVSQIHDPNDPSKALRRFMGQTVVSPFFGEDIEAPLSLPREARIATYYIFSDLSCRQNGLYRLKFVLNPLTVDATVPGGRTESAAEALSDVFEVFSAKDFPGMRASSALTIELKRQGATVPVKKGNEAKSGKKSKKRGSDSEGSSSDPSDDASMSKSAGKKPRS